MAAGSRHRWRYRGQVVPGNRRVTVQAVVTGREDDGAGGRLTADGWLLVDGRVIYQMNDFTLSASPSPPPPLPRGERGAKESPSPLPRGERGLQS